MPRTTIYRAEIERLEILDPDGQLDESLAPRLSDEQLVELLVTMLRMRAYDDKALNLQRQGRMGTFGSLRGQEAAQAGLAYALQKDDWLAPSFRDQGILEAHGVPMELWYAFCKGDERSSLFPPAINALPPAIPVGSQLLHAAGIGIGLRMRGLSGAAVGLAGDGATSEGDFHEALNFAGALRAKTLFYIQNNGWAISVPISRQTASETIAQKAIAYGVPGVQVDGNDVLAVYAACNEALEHVRAGNGPYLIEAVTYRLGSHTTADDATRYRPGDEVAHWEARDPIVRLRALLSRRGVWDEQRERAAMAEIAEQVDGAVARLEAMQPPPVTDIFDHLYEELPPKLREQRDELEAEVRR